MDYSFIKDTIFETVDFSYDGEIEFYVCDGLEVTYKDDKASIGAKEKAQVARGCFLLAMNLSEGKTEFIISEKMTFTTCGNMLDCSRNAVMKPEAVKKYMNCMAALGMNALMLYTEDTFEVPGRPRLGYMRGRYTAEELKELAAYGDKIGVELIPNIQTLGHMGQYLRWSRAYAPDYTGEDIFGITDTSTVLLCGEEKTYDFIEAMVKHCRECFTSNRIHIGMDEAHDLGLGNYLKKNGYHNRVEIMTKHLARVVEICEKYGFKPLMYSDMFFRLASIQGYSQVPADFEFPKELKKQIPNCELVFWDYYHKEHEYYETVLRIHEQLGQTVAFMGGAGTWYGHLPSHCFSYANADAAARACVSRKVDTVFSSMWGDDGNECNAFYALTLLTIYAEYCYKGEKCTKADIARASQFLTKVKFEDAEALSALCYPSDSVPENVIMGKRLLYADILYDLAIDAAEAPRAMEAYKNARAKTEEIMKTQKTYQGWCKLAYTIYSICYLKAELAKNLRNSYQAGEKAYLKKTVDEIIPELIKLYTVLSETHKAEWNSTYKPFGYEVLSFRYGGLIARLNDAAEKLTQYLNGEIEKIEELEEKLLINEGGFLQPAYRTITASNIF